MVVRCQWGLAGVSGVGEGGGAYRPAARTHWRRTPAGGATPRGGPRTHSVGLRSATDNSLRHMPPASVTTQLLIQIDHLMN